jgi:hypothetical protein
VDATIHVDEELIEMRTPMRGDRDQAIDNLACLLGRYETWITLRFFAPSHEKGHPPIFVGGERCREVLRVIVSAAQGFWSPRPIGRIIIAEFCDYAFHRFAVAPSPPVRR